MVGKPKKQPVEEPKKVNCNSRITFHLNEESVIKAGFPASDGSKWVALKIDDNEITIFLRNEKQIDMIGDALVQLLNDLNVHKYMQARKERS